MVDIDCHASGTLEGATQFAEFLRENYFPNLYFEVSTHGNGIQGFVVVDRRLWKRCGVQGSPRRGREVAQAGVALDALRRRGRGAEGDAAGRLVGQQAGRSEQRDLRLPGEDAQGLDVRFEEWQSTTRMTAHELRELPERFPVPEPEAGARSGAESEEPVRKVAKGSVLGKLVDPDDVRKLEPLARKLLSVGSPEVKTVVEGGDRRRGRADGARHDQELAPCTRTLTGRCR